MKSLAPASEAMLCLLLVENLTKPNRADPSCRLCRDSILIDLSQGSARCPTEFDCVAPAEMDYRESIYHEVMWIQGVLKQ